MCVCCGCTQSRRPRAGRRWGGQWRRRGVRDIREQPRAPIAELARPGYKKEENSAAGRGRVSRLSQLVFAAGWGAREASARATYLQLTYGPRRTQSRSQSQSVQGVHEPAVSRRTKNSVCLTRSQCNAVRLT